MWCRRYRISEELALGFGERLRLQAESALRQRTRQWKVNADSARVAALRKAGRSWSEICKETGLTEGTAQRSVYGLPKNHGVAEQAFHLANPAGCTGS